MRPTQSIRRARRRRNAAVRNAAVTLEAILCVPVLVIAFFAVVEFGMILVVQNAVTSAAIKAAKKSAEGGALADAKTAAETVMAVHSMAVMDDNILIERTDSVGALTTHPAATTCTSGLATLAPNANQTRVTLCFPLPAGPIGNFLSTLGFDLTGKRFNITAYADVE